MCEHLFGAVDSLVPHYGLTPSFDVPTLVLALATDVGGNEIAFSKSTNKKRNS